MAEVTQISAGTENIQENIQTQESGNEPVERKMEEGENTAAEGKESQNKQDKPNNNNNKFNDRKRKQHDNSKSGKNNNHQKQHQHQKKVSKRVFDASDLPASNDETEILKQVEFYFSDANLPKDKFLWNETRKDPEGKGWVQIEVLAKFNRMRRFLPLENVVAALKKSSGDVIEVNEDGTKVRRTTKLIPTRTDHVEKRSVYAKGFGTEEKHTQVDLEKFFEEFGKVNAVRLRRADDGSFKGSVFVEYAMPESAEKFLSEPRKYKDTELITMSKKDYTEMKTEELKTREQDPHVKPRHQNRPFNAFAEMKNDNAKKALRLGKGERPNKRAKFDKKGNGEKQDDAEKQEDKNDGENGGEKETSGV